jgi:non-canonical (house-cleaning) NTP pyrophosphatase
MKKIILSSNNKVKVQVVEEAVKLLFPKDEFTVVSTDLETDGPEPIGEQALLAQLYSSIVESRKLHPDGYYYISMEGGVVENEGGMDELACVVIEDAGLRKSISRSVSFPIPPDVADYVRKGVPFATAVETVYLAKGVKTGGGFVDMLTNNHVDKKALYLQPTVVAFSKFLKSDWFFKYRDIVKLF